jgi:hypothetical protein
MKRKYIVYGWLDGKDYDNNLESSCTTKVTAKDGAEAEDIACQRFKKKYGTCDVILAFEKK